MRKTDRKNKTNQTVTWPTNIFTIKELNGVNPEFVEITLRTRLKKALESGKVKEMGVLHNGKGRPTIVFVYGVPTESHIDDAKTRGVILKDGLVVNVLNVNQGSTPSSDVVITVKTDVNHKVGA
jgi:hypothetical protein